MAEDEQPQEHEQQQEQEIEINFRLDHHGRTAPSQEAPQTDRTSMDYRTQTRQCKLRPVEVEAITSSESSFVPSLSSWMDELLLDCEIADSALMPRTFWVPAKTTTSSSKGEWTPRCSLEQMALDVFCHHTVHLSLTDQELEQSGAEWWVQIRPSPKGGRYAVLEEQQKQDIATDVQEDLSKEGISFHWDKDEDLRLLLGGNTYIHPHISTVTYLTSTGAPTLAINCRINPLTGEWMCPKNHNNNNSVAASTDPGDVAPDTSPPTTETTQDKAEAFLSWPSPLKHLSFDGRYLHAAPPTLATAAATTTSTEVRNGEEAIGSSSLLSDACCTSKNNNPKIGPGCSKREERRKRRVTFLVNIWLYFRPLNVEPFPESMLDKMSGRTASSTPKTPRLGLTLSEQRHAVHSMVLNVDTNPNNKNDKNHNPHNSTVRYTWPMGNCGSGESIHIWLPAKEQWHPSLGQDVCITWNSLHGLRLCRLPDQPPDDQQNKQEQPQRPLKKRPRIEDSRQEGQEHE